MTENQTDKGSIIDIWQILVVLFITTVLSRGLLANGWIFNMDAGNFVHALRHGFDMNLEQPHPPGYFLYVLLGRALNFFVADASSTLRYMSILFSALTVLLCYESARCAFDHRTGIAAAVIAVTSPLFWFYGIVGLTYAIECFFSLLIVWLGIRLLHKDRKSIWMMAFVLALAGGFRPTTMILLYPLFIYSIRAEGMKRILFAHVIVLVTVSAYLVPQIHMTGGLDRYIQLHREQSRRVIGHGSILKTVAGQLAVQVCSIAWGLSVGLVPMLRLLVNRLKGDVETKPSNAWFVFLTLWTIPAVTFFILVHSPGGAPGYALVYMGALFIVCGRSISIESANIATHTANQISQKKIFVLYLSFVACVNISLFLFTPYPFSYTWLQKQKATVLRYTNTIDQNFSPETTVLLAGADLFVSFRHAGLLLPEYIVSDIVLQNGGYLTMRRGQSKRTRRFPLPPEPRYAVYFGKVEESDFSRFNRCVAQSSFIGNGLYLVYFRIENLAPEFEIKDFFFSNRRCDK